jgi:hypothetical protein
MFLYLIYNFYLNIKNFHYHHIMIDPHQESNMYDMQNINHEDSQRVYENQENF